MIYSIFFALVSALFAANPSSASFADDQKRLQPVFENNDSSMLSQLRSKFEAQYHKFAPEKVYLQLDRSIFEPGETLWFKAYLRNAGDLRPSSQSQFLHVELKDARGAILAKKELLALDGVALGEFDFGQNLPGGIYKIRAYTNWMQNTREAFERDITLQKMVLPNVNLKLEFERKAFGASEVVIAKFDAQSLDNKPIANKKISFTANIGGKTIFESETQTNENGRAYVRFTLPETLESSDGLLNVRLEHNGLQEAISRAIPIVLQKLDLQFFPEGGDAVAGIACRIAFKALNEFGKPADVSGVILDSEGAEVASFCSFHDGMGAFDFTPKAGVQYTAQITKPFVSDQIFLLPTANSQGVVMRLRQNDPSFLRISLSGTHSSKVFLVGTQGDKICYFKSLKLNSAAQTVTIPVESLPIGIARFTVLDENKVELAERLVFIGHKKGLKIDIETDKSEYLPREQVVMQIRVRDHAGKPVQGHFSLAVVDEKLLSFADDKQGHLLSSMLLEQDLKGVIETPGFYFDTTEPKSEEALDYLLMTQGWRRFTWESLAQTSNYQHEPKLAVLEGQLWRKDGKPSWGGTVSLYPGGPSVRTNQQGFFSFKQVDISPYTHIRYGNGLLYPITGYSDDIVLVLPKRIKNKHYTYTSFGGDYGPTILSGKLTDEEDGLIGATVKVSNENGFVRGTRTDYNGDFRIQLDPGVYDVEFSYTGFQSERIIGLDVNAGKTNQLNLQMNSSTLLQEVQIIAYKIPLIQQDQTSSGQILTSDQIRNIPTRKVNAIVATTVGATSIDGGDVNIKGARSNATNYYIDGIRVTGGIPPVQDIEQLAINSLSPFRNQYFHRARQFYSPMYDQQNPVVAGTDFRSTLYWNPNIKTDKAGNAEVRFFCSDAVTSFRATLEGMGIQGEIGRQEQHFFVQKPLSIAVKTPASVIAGDVLQLQVAISNKTRYVNGGHLVVQMPAHFQPIVDGTSDFKQSVQLAAGETKILQLEYAIGQPQSPDQKVKIQFMTDEIVADAFEANIRCLDRGFPVQLFASGNEAQNRFNFHLSDPVEGSISASLATTGNPVQEVIKCMDRMLRQPCGCFEQVSSSNYPNLLVLDLLRNSGQNRPDLESTAMKYLEDGYKKLVAYECKSGGFDWYGRDPGHEGLTAYGLMEFTDMARVFQVDKSLIDRTANWLLARRDGKGGWNVNAQSLHGWKNDDVLRAYISWAVAEAGYGAQFLPEIEQSYQLAIESEDAHIIALIANTMAAIKDKRAAVLLAKLRQKQTPEGYWKGASHSAFHSQGSALDVETTALVALAFLKQGQISDEIESAIRFIGKSKNEYGYGNTQSTVLALKALVEYAKLNKGQESNGALVVQIDGKRVPEAAFSHVGQGVQIAHLEQYFSHNDPVIEVYFEVSQKPAPFDISVQYSSRTPQDAKNCPISFKTSLAQTSVAIGQTVRISAILKNETEALQHSPMIVLGIPSGLSLQAWQLKKLMDEQKCDFYELWDGQAVFHFRQLNPNEIKEISLDLRADVAGKFEAPASQAFLYYNNEQRVWSKPERLEIH